jgi:hypothetical protein
MLDPDMDAAHQETQDEAIEAAFNPLGRHVSIDTGPSYQTQRQKAPMRHS